MPGILSQDFKEFFTVPLNSDKSLKRLQMAQLSMVDSIKQSGSVTNSTYYYQHYIIRGWDYYA